jgi:hypothetical protein
MHFYSSDVRGDILEWISKPVLILLGLFHNLLHSRMAHRKDIAGQEEGS